MGFLVFPHSFNSANQVAVPLIFSQGHNMNIPQHLFYHVEPRYHNDMEGEKEFEKRARAQEREALCRAVEMSVIQQELAKCQRRK